MKFMTLHSHIKDSFFRCGWLLPALLPLTQLGGRALFNGIAGVYALWGLVSLWSRRERLDRTITGLYLALLGVFLLGISGSLDPQAGLRLWGEVVAQSLTLLLMHIALQESPAHLDRLLRLMAGCGVITLAGLYVLLPYHALGGSGQPFDPSSQLQEDSLPFLLPFMLGWVWRQGRGRWRTGAMVLVTAAVLGYVVLAEGRAALFGLIVGLTIFCGSVMGWRWRWIALLILGVLALSIVVNTGPFRKAELDPNHPLDAFTSGRTILWRQALQHPPDRMWLGVGIGNGSYAKEVLSFQMGGERVQVKHLHNVLMDVWYETGLLGLGALLALMGAVFGRLAWVWRRLAAGDRQRAGVLLAAAFALMAAGLLSFSYTSRYFACYFFACLGGLSYFATRPASADTNPDRR